jgi:hypothetical protein
MIWFNFVTPDTVDQGVNPRGLIAAAGVCLRQGEVG